jgi:1,4-alpha-glucan branching enzyme
MESNNENKESINICHTPSLRSDDFDQTDVQDKIDELNLMTETDKVSVHEQSAKVSMDIKDNAGKISSNEEVNKIEDNKLSEFEVINQDPYLKSYESRIKERVNAMKNLIIEIEKNEGEFIDFCRSYRNMGLHVTDEGITFREYAPSAHEMTIVIVYLTSLGILITGIEINTIVQKTNMDFGV